MKPNKEYTNEQDVLDIIQDERKRQAIIDLIMQSDKLGKLFYEERDGVQIGKIYGMKIALIR